MRMRMRKRKNETFLKKNDLSDGKKFYIVHFFFFQIEKRQRVENSYTDVRDDSFHSDAS